MKYLSVKSIFFVLSQKLKFQYFSSCSNPIKKTLLPNESNFKNDRFLNGVIVHSECFRVMRMIFGQNLISGSPLVSFTYNFF